MSQGNIVELGTEKKPGREIESKRERRRVHLHLLRLCRITAAGVKHASRRSPGGAEGEKGTGWRIVGDRRGVDFGAPIVLIRDRSRSRPHARAPGNKYKNRLINPKVSQARPRRQGSRRGRERKREFNYP